MGPKTYAPTGALPPASARVRAPGPKTGPVGAADTAPKTAPRTAPVPPPPPPTTTTAHYQNTIDLNHKLTKEVAKLKKDIVTQQQDHDRRTADLLGQIADLTTKLETTTTDKNNIYNHYQHWKTTWTTQIADQKRQLDAFATTFEVMAKRPRT